VVELAWIEIDQELNIIDRRYSLIDPEVAIPASASGIHGITNIEVANSPTLDEFFNIVLPGEGGSAEGNVILIAHNTVFDRRFLKERFNLVGELCTLRLARRVWPDMENHKLATLMYALELRRGQSHSAEGDVDTCHDLLCKIVETSGKSLLDLAQTSMEPVLITKMPFGKHKGVLLKNLPGSYTKWLMGLDTLDKDMRYSLEHFYGKF
jgi:exodeoxyribonuclease X